MHQTQKLSPELDLICCSRNIYFPVKYHNSLFDVAEVKTKTSLWNFLKMKPIFLILWKICFILLHKVTEGACSNSNALLLLNFQCCCLTWKKRDWEKFLGKSTHLCCKCEIWLLMFWKTPPEFGMGWLLKTNSNIPARQLWFYVYDGVSCITLNLPTQYWKHLTWLNIHSKPCFCLFCYPFPEGKKMFTVPQ